MTTRAAIYLRISSDAKADGLANERQREDCESLCAYRGWEVFGTYSDTASASKRTVHRPEYERMRKDYEAGLFDALVVWDLDRLTRQPRELEDWIEAAEDRGLVVATANGEADLSTDGGRMYARIKASVARAEVERKSARQRRKNQQLAESGLPTGAWRRFGWEKDNITVRESEAKYLREAADRVLAGDSLRSILRWFEAEGVETLRGGPWLHGTLRHYLTRERMAGLLVYRGVVQPSSQIQPILDKERWEELCAVLSDPRRRTNRGRESAHWLSSVLICPCGSPMAGKAVHGKGAKVPTYVCRATTFSVRGGSHRSISARDAEAVGAAALYFGLRKRIAMESDTSSVSKVRAETSDIRARIERLESVYEVTGSQSSLSRLVELRSDLDASEHRLDAALADASASAVVNAARSAPEGEGGLDMGSLAAFTRSFRLLSVEKKRTLALATMRGRVARGGKGALKRVDWEMFDGTPLILDGAD